MTKTQNTAPPEPIVDRPNGATIQQEAELHNSLTQNGGSQSMVPQDPNAGGLANNNINAARGGLAATSATGASANGQDVTMSGKSNSGGGKRRKTKTRKSKKHNSKKKRKKQKSKKRRRSKKR